MPRECCTVDMPKLPHDVWFPMLRVWASFFPGVTIPLKQPEGFTWLAKGDYASATLLFEGVWKQEEAERQFVSRYLQPGMNVLDIGAHHGFYSLLASKRVGSAGTVLAFEPAPPALHRLREHLSVNECTNVGVAPVAVSSNKGSHEFHVTTRGDSGTSNLFQKPGDQKAAETIVVVVVALDEYLSERNFPHQVDLVKMDAEGNELPILTGARLLLSRQPRPVVLCELLSAHEPQTGLPVRAVYEAFIGQGFSWYEAEADGTLKPFADTGQPFANDLVAVPPERLADLSQRGLLTVITDILP